MKNLFITMAVCAISAVSASAGTAVPDTLLIKPQLTNPELKTEKNICAEEGVRDLPGNISTIMRKKMPDIREVRLLTEVLQREKLDSIVSYLNVVAAKEKFTKQDFTYYDNGLPHKMTNYYWSFAEEKWDDPAESTEFIVDDDGYVTSLIQMSGDNGARTDYVYDDKKLGIQQTVSGYSPTTDEWIPIQRGDYEYDDAGNMISEKISAWDTAAKTWMPVIKNFATWDEFGRQTGFEPYYFLSNGELEGNGEKQTYTYDKHGNKDLIESYIWNATGWQMYVKYIREFNDNNLLTYAEKKFYNPDTGTWDGCYDWFETGQLIPNTKSIIEYDDKNRDIHEVAYTAYTLENGYEVGSENFTVYTELEDGGLQSEFTSYLIYGPGNEDRTPFVNNHTTERYNAAGLLLVQEEQHIDMMTGQVRNYQKNVHTYNDAGSETSRRAYMPDRSTENWDWAANNGYDLIYDENNNVTEQFNYRGSGPDDWTYSARFTYKYENGNIMVEKMNYLYDGANWIPSWGDGYVYDYNVKMDDIADFPNGPAVTFKLLETRSYNYSTELNDFDYTSFVYYYSDLKTPTGITYTNGQASSLSYKDGKITTGNADAIIKVYNMSGMLVDTGHSIDMNLQPNGIYIAETDGQRIKLVKK